LTVKTTAMSVDYVTATTNHIIDKITYIVIAKPSETARVTIQIKSNNLILKELRKLADKVANKPGKQQGIPIQKL